jgi:hypothetical protein
MPTGCGLWPAWWSVGGNKAWPAGGEIDIIEGVNNIGTNQLTLHTSEGCTLDSNILNSTHTGSILDTECASSAANNNGCAFGDSNPQSFGETFNNVGGGVYAHIWNDSGIYAWHFARNAIPPDIPAKAPQPDSWGVPVAMWSASTCDMSQHFSDHVLVFDTTLCGDWAGSVYPYSGCPGTCEEAVADPNNFNSESRLVPHHTLLQSPADAQWHINSVAVYN